MSNFCFLSKIFLVTAPPPVLASRNGYAFPFKLAPPHGLRPYLRIIRRVAGVHRKKKNYDATSRTRAQPDSKSQVYGKAERFREANTGRGAVLNNDGLVAALLRCEICGYG